MIGRTEVFVQLTGSSETSYRVTIEKKRDGPRVLDAKPPLTRPRGRRSWTGCKTIPFSLPIVLILVTA
jgi:hypothetical protein